jgi:hypothetical protein
MTAALGVALQAVQLLPEHRVWPGQSLVLTASHDTYAISFSLTAAATQPQPLVSSTQPSSCAFNNSSTEGQDKTCSAAAAAAAFTDENEDDNMAPTATMPASAAPATPQPTGVPVVDPAWKAAYDAVAALQASLAKAAAQDPLEYRRLATATLLLAMRPWGSKEAAAATEVASREEQQEGVRDVGLLEPGSRNGRAAEAPRQAAVGAAGSGVLVSRQPAADPHHAAALVVRFMS